MDVGAVVFDFYGTLTAGRSQEEQETARRAQAEALGVEVGRFDAELSATVHERFEGAGGSVEGSLRWIAERLGSRPSPGQVQRAAELRLAAERRFGEPRPDAVPTLRAVRERGLRVGLVSDCSAELPTYFADLPIAPLVDAPVFSFVTGHRKPAPENYLRCCAELGVPPTRCVYVGDGGSNELAGARALGMRAVYLAVEVERDGVVYGRHLSWDGYTITALPQLLDLL